MRLFFDKKAFYKFFAVLLVFLLLIPFSILALNHTNKSSGEVDVFSRKDLVEINEDLVLMPINDLILNFSQPIQETFTPNENIVWSQTLTIENPTNESKTFLLDLNKYPDKTSPLLDADIIFVLNNESKSTDLIFLKLEKNQLFELKIIYEYPAILLNETIKQGTIKDYLPSRLWDKSQ